MSSFVVNAELRTDTGKGASRRLRHAGKVPAVLYGGKDPAISLTLVHKDMKKHLETEAFYSHILTLKVNGKEEQAVLKDIQRHPATPLLMHFDFQRVYADQAIHVHVPLHFKGAEVSPGVKLNAGVVEHHVVQVDVECLPKDLPEFIEVDMSAMNVDDTIHLSDLKVPEGVTLSDLKAGNDGMVAAIHPPRAVVEETTEEVPAGEVPAAAIKEPAEGDKKAADAKPGDKPEEKKK